MFYFHPDIEGGRSREVYPVVGSAAKEKYLSKHEPDGIMQVI